MKEERKMSETDEERKKNEGERKREEKKNVLDNLALDNRKYL
jgi:hypothetical protein